MDEADLDDDVEVQVGSVEAVHTGFLRLAMHRLRYRRFDGSMSPMVVREVVERGSSVCVLPYDPDLDKVLLIRTFLVGALIAGRPARPLQVIAGMVDGDESAEAAARREAMEEAGCAIKRIVTAHTFLPSPGSSSERVTVFCGQADLRDAGGIHGNQDEGEDIRAGVIDADVAIRVLDSGRIEAGPAVIALSWFARHRDRLRREWSGAGASTPSHPEPKGPATDAVAMMETAIETHRRSKT